MNEYSHLLFFKHFGFLRVCQAHITTYQAGVQSMELENLKYPESWRTAWGQYFYILLLLSWGGGGEKRKKKKKDRTGSQYSYFFPSPVQHRASAVSAAAGSRAEVKPRWRTAPLAAAPSGAEREIRQPSPAPGDPIPKTMAVSVRGGIYSFASQINSVLTETPHTCVFKTRESPVSHLQS